MTLPHAPLTGLRVLDLTNVLAGPFCCHLLAHMGAEVIKVEPPGSGDLARQLGADPDLNAQGMGVSFLAQNAGKRSITLNLKSAAGRDALLRLADGADVLVENFRPGVMERLDLGWEVLHGRAPNLVVCAISGFGQTGPLVTRPAYDQIIQGMSGVMSVTGDKDSAPLRVGYPLADTTGGWTAAFAIASALVGRAQTGGVFVDVSMLASVMGSMGWVISNHLIAGVTPEPQGNENPTSAPSGTFACADGLINIAANRDTQWEALTEVLGLSDLMTRAEYATREARKSARKALNAELEAKLRTAAVAVWVDALNARGVPAGPVLSVPDALTSGAVDGLLARYDDVPGIGRGISTVKTGVRINGEAPSVAAPPPRLGQDTEAILADLGYSTDDIAKMRSDGAI